MKNILLSILLLVGCIATVSSQVYTKRYETGVALKQHQNFETSKKNTTVRTMPIFNISSLIEEDETLNK